MKLIRSSELLWLFSDGDHARDGDDHGDDGDDGGDGGDHGDGGVGDVSNYLRAAHSAVHFTPHCLK